MMKETFTFFWQSRSPFSQWYPSNFVLEGIRFYCAEQAMMYHKAILFGDKEIAQKILQAKEPREQKALGRKVKNFDKKRWDSMCKQIVYTANEAKFTQNEELLQILLATEGTTLVEASPVDTIWGIGLAADDPRALDRTKWRGTNWLGEVLTELREDILKKVSSRL